MKACLLAALFAILSAPYFVGADEVKCEQINPFLVAVETEGKSFIGAIKANLVTFEPTGKSKWKVALDPTGQTLGAVALGNIDREINSARVAGYYVKACKSPRGIVSVVLNKSAKLPENPICGAQPKTAISVLQDAVKAAR